MAVATLAVNRLTEKLCAKCVHNHNPVRACAVKVMLRRYCAHRNLRELLNHVFTFDPKGGILFCDMYLPSNNGQIHTPRTDDRRGRQERDERNIG